MGKTNALLMLLGKIPSSISTKLFCGRTKNKEPCEDAGNDGCIEADEDEDSDDGKPVVKKIKMLNGFLVCPGDYIILNRSEAGHCKYASVVAVRNAGFDVPHFVYFSSKEASDYTDNDVELIEKACVGAWPRFKELIGSWVDPIKDANGHYLNVDEICGTPVIGHFPIFIQDDERYPSDSDPQMEAKIVRK